FGARDEQRAEDVGNLESAPTGGGLAAGNPEEVAWRRVLIEIGNLARHDFARSHAEQERDQRRRGALVATVSEIEGLLVPGARLFHAKRLAFLAERLSARAALAD